MKVANGKLSRESVVEKSLKASENGHGKVRAEQVTISPANLQVVTFKIRGSEPLCLNQFTEKAKQMMRDKQVAGTQANKGKKREPKDFNQLYEQARYRSDEGWDGFPAGAIRSNMIDACRLVGFKMTLAKLSVFVIADGLDQRSRTPLVRITKGQPKPHEAVMRNATGVCDIRVRPLWEPGWEATLRIRYDADQFTRADIANLLDRCGKQLGLGEGRPNSRDSAGCGWGLFQIVS